MDAASLLAFEQAAQKAAERVYPGRVRIDGVEYDVALYYGPIERRLASEDGGGSYFEQGMFFDLSKDRLEIAPATGAVIEDLSSEEMWIIESVDGHGLTDAAWLVGCIKHPE